MWREGLVWAFATREEVEQALVGQQPGTFVVRFSERHAGMFVVSYKISRRVEEYYRAVAAPPTSGTPSVKHYLIKIDEISIKKTLPDFLVDTAGLSSIVRVLHNDFGADLDPPNPLPDPLYIPMPKGEALDKFVSKREQITLVGYEPSLAPMPM